MVPIVPRASWDSLEVLPRGVHVRNGTKDDLCFGQKNVLAATAIFSFTISWACFASVKVERKHCIESLSCLRYLWRGTSKRCCTLWWMI